MSSELKQLIKDLQEKLVQLKEYLDLESKKQRLAEIESIMAQDGFWDSPDKNTAILKERTSITALVEGWEKLEEELSEAEVLFELGVEEEDSQTIEEARQHLVKIEKGIDKLSLSRMLDGEDDARNAIVAINAGAGGTDAQDWAEMLLRMYLRWVEQKGFSYSILDYQPGDEAGVKSVTFTVTGDYAYGYLKTEEGVHRLVRISPFNSNGKRQTSFASVAVYPEIDQEIVVDVNEKDLRVDVFRASGAGGQHVNKTSSAVRILHIPTGIVVQCQQEKSQHRNRDLAMKVLKARLYQVEQEQQQKQMQDNYEAKEDIGFGNQIRSYVIHPYQMVKDHRINMDVGNVNAVLDGDIDPFIEAVLLSGHK
ncbi:peptide chain release factor 2 [Desulfatibacillum alkenivorans]|nr:peptide chain release factor 2 [Desulfatibacillum alkenivorans]